MKSGEGVARFWNHLEEEVGLETEAHDQEEPEKDAISELSDHFPLCLRAMEVERLKCCWGLTPTE